MATFPERLQKLVGYSVHASEGGVGFYARDKGRVPLEDFPGAWGAVCAAAQ